MAEEKTTNEEKFDICVSCGKVTSFKKTDTEFCVNCGARTNYTKDDPINYRYGYVKGVGQYCFRCSYFGGKDKAN